eukprot:6781693-Prymnesium_polylepis.1
MSTKKGCALMRPIACAIDSSTPSDSCRRVPSRCSASLSSKPLTICNQGHQGHQGKAIKVASRPSRPSRPSRWHQGGIKAIKASKAIKVASRWHQGHQGQQGGIKAIQAIQAIKSHNGNQGGIKGNQGNQATCRVSSVIDWGSVTSLFLARFSESFRFSPTRFGARADGRLSGSRRARRARKPGGGPAGAQGLGRPRSEELEEGRLGRRGWVGQGLRRREEGRLGSNTRLELAEAAYRAREQHKV